MKSPSTPSTILKIFDQNRYIQPLSWFSFSGLNAEKSKTALKSVITTVKTVQIKNIGLSVSSEAKLPSKPTTGPEIRLKIAPRRANQGATLTKNSTTPFGK